MNQWKADKNIKKSEMPHIVRRRQKRRLQEPEKPDLVFTVRGREVDARKIDRWMQANKTAEDELYAPSPAACKF